MAEKNEPHGRIGDKRHLPVTRRDNLHNTILLSSLENGRYVCHRISELLEGWEIGWGIFQPKSPRWSRFGRIDQWRRSDCRKVKRWAYYLLLVRYFRFGCTCLSGSA